jgi:ribosomal protein S18 acetylase RimI-like enzyme
MGNLVSIKQSLHDARVLEVLSYCHYKPDEEKMRRLADQYERDEDVFAFGFLEGGAWIGVIALRRLPEARYEILGIAVDPSRRGEGIGREMLEEAIRLLGCGALLAETDDDAVDFYKSCGFVVSSLGMKYPGVERYRCERRADTPRVEFSTSE